MTKKRKRKKKVNVSGLLAGIIFSLITVALLIGVFYLRDIQAEITASATPTPEPTPAPVLSTMVSETAVPAEPTPQPTPDPTPEPQPEYFRLSFIGDNTLKALKQFEFSEYGLDVKVGDNYAYPYQNTAKYFAEDEYTLANLECSFSDEKLPYDYTATTFAFVAKSAYVNILLDGNVDFVTMCNNHARDCYEAGVESTQTVLNEAGLPFGYENEGHLVTTPNGIKLGIWTAGNDLLPNTDKAVQGIQDLRAQGADIVICMFHWGQELYYTPNDNQITLAHKCIDAGADIVYGSHPHCLQPIEIYNGKLIMYSLGNWVFGGNTSPTDCDTAIIQAIIKRDVDGTISYDDFHAIPCCVSSNIEGANNREASYNDYCPTPYEEGSEPYERTMSKLMGTYEATSQGADYTNFYASWA